MIPYEELCDALARWRAKNGLGGGPTRAPARSFSPPPPAPAAMGGSPAAALAFVPSTTTPEALPVEDPTAIGIEPAPAPIEATKPRREDSTSEIDIDSVDVVEEEEA